MDKETERKNKEFFLKQHNYKDGPIGDLYWEKHQEEVELNKHGVNIKTVRLFDPKTQTKLSFQDYKKKYGRDVALHMAIHGLDSYVSKAIRGGSLAPAEKNEVNTEQAKKRAVAAYKAKETRKKNEAARSMPKAGSLAEEALKEKEEVERKNAEALSTNIIIEEDEDDDDLELCNPNQFMKLSYSVLQSKGWRSLKGLEPMMLLELMKRVISSKRQRDSNKLYKNFYKNKYLACCVKQSDLAKWFECSTSNIRYCLKSLEKKGFIIKDKSPKYKTKNIYIVGILNNGKEEYYIER